MPSPFPGMNPYLEQEDAWHDFHERFLLVATILGGQLRPRYIVKIEPWSAGSSDVSTPSSGPSRSVSDCPWFPRPSERLTPTPNSTCKLS